MSEWWCREGSEGFPSVSSAQSRNVDLNPRTQGPTEGYKAEFVCCEKTGFGQT